MKYIVFSFDDGRKDTYTEALPILKKYGLTATVNIVPDYILHAERYPQFLTQAMTVDMILQMQREGYEIACHGYSHQNTAQDVLKNIDSFAQWGLDTAELGFASPYSELTQPLGSEFAELLAQKKLAYIRSGTQIRREGAVYAAAAIANDRLHAKRLFYSLNKDKPANVKEKRTFYQGVGINCHTSVGEIAYMLEKMPDEHVLILIYHSVLDAQQMQRYQNKWTTDKQDFEALCAWVAQNKALSAVTMKDVLHFSSEQVPTA